MFNNPFESFHNTVAEAKDEREQLDRLLTVSTPRERLLVVVIAILLAAFAGWLFLGSVDRNVAVDGVLVDAGRIQSTTGQAVQALVWIGNDARPVIRTGMAAVIDLGSAEEIGGVISSVSAVGPSELPARFESAGSVSVRLVAIALEEGPDLAPLVGRQIRIVVETGAQSPFELLRPG